jgi:hypothetical protein
MPRCMNMDKGGTYELAPKKKRPVVKCNQARAAVLLHRKLWKLVANLLHSEQEDLPFVRFRVITAVQMEGWQVRFWIAFRTFPDAAGSDRF